jgi:hypothetical protein
MAIRRLLFEAVDPDLWRGSSRRWRTCATLGLTVVGWALISMRSLPPDYIFASPLERENQRGFIAALYPSWVRESALGFGDITPTRGWLRVLAVGVDADA